MFIKSIQQHASQNTGLLGYFSRLIGSQFIPAVTGETWYQPRVTLPAAADAADLAIDSSADTTGCAVTPALFGTLTDYAMRQNSRALLLMQGGKLKYAAYNRFKPEGVFNSMSLLKSVIGLAIGIAIDKGILPSVDTFAVDYLPEWANDRRKLITIEHLLMMQSGLKSDSTFGGLQLLPPVVKLYLGATLHRTALTLPAVADAGVYFEYNNYNSQILGIILERASGMSIAQFLSVHLWQHLRCHEASLWLDRKDGHARTFGALFARPKDWLKLGQLFLDQGQHNGVQIVSQEWLAKMIVPRNTAERGVKDGRADYGYHIWLKAHDYGLIRGIPSFEATHARTAHDDGTMFYFEGMRAQYLFISPRHQLVVMRMGERPLRSWDGSYLINEITRVLAINKTTAGV